MRPALLLLLAAALVSPALAFTSVSTTGGDRHADVTHAAWRLVGELDRAKLADMASCPHPEDLDKMVRKADGYELAVLTDRLADAPLPLAPRATAQQVVTTGAYRAAHHFDRSYPTAGSVDAFLDGVAFLREQWGIAVAPGSSPQAAVVALTRAVHALQDFHAHSNVAELTTAVDAARLDGVFAVERAVWPEAPLPEPPPEARRWYTLEDPARIAAALDLVDDCLAPWGRATRCDPALAERQLVRAIGPVGTPEARALLDSVLVLTYLPGGDVERIDPTLPPGMPTPPAIALLPQRGEPVWCGSSDTYQCYTREARATAERTAPRDACTQRFVGDTRHIPREVEYTHACHAKDEPRFGVGGASRAGRWKARTWADARDQAALRTALLLHAAREAVGAERWSAMMESAEGIADRAGS